MILNEDWYLEIFNYSIGINISEYLFILKVDLLFIFFLKYYV